MSGRLAQIGRVFKTLCPHALIAFLYIATWPFHSGLNNPNEMVRVYMTKAMIDYKTVEIGRVLREWGGVDDKALRENKLYSSKAPLQSLVGAPAYAAYAAIVPKADKRTATIVLRIFGSAIFGMIFAGLLLEWSRRRAIELGALKSSGTAIGLALALGTMLYPCAITFSGHLLAAFAATGCFFALLAASRQRVDSARWRLLVLLAGFGAGAAPFAEYPATLVALPAALGGLFTAARGRRIEFIVLMAAGALLPIAIGLYVHKLSWGSPFKTGYSFLENRSFAEHDHAEGFFGVSHPRPEASSDPSFRRASACSTFPRSWFSAWWHSASIPHVASRTGAFRSR